MQNDLNVEEKRGEMVVDLTRKRVREDEVLDVPDEVGAPEPKKKKKAPRSRNWFGTLNNPTDEEKALISSWRVSSQDKVTWCAFFNEVGKEGTPHLQFCFNLLAPQDFGWLKNGNLPGLKRAHFEKMKGTCDQALEYCSKDGNPFFCSGRKPAKRGAEAAALLQEFTQDIKNGSITPVEVYNKYPALYLRYYKAIENVRQIFQREVRRTFPDGRRGPVVTWLWGETGAGKSFKARADAELVPGDLYQWGGVSNGGAVWMDGYTNQRKILCDDIEKHVPFKWLLKLLDEYEFMMPVKGGHTYLQASHIWITSDYDPAEIDQSGQLMRRITYVKQMYKRDRPDVREMIDREVAELLVGGGAEAPPPAPVPLERVPPCINAVLGQPVGLPEWVGDAEILRPDEPDMALSDDDDFVPSFVCGGGFVPETQ